MQQRDGNEEQPERVACPERRLCNKAPAPAPVPSPHSHQTKQRPSIHPPSSSGSCGTGYDDVIGEEEGEGCLAGWG